MVARVLELDRRGRLRPLALQSPPAAELLPGLSEEERLASFHVVEPDGAVHSAGAALPALFARLPGGRPLARLARRFPRAAARGYRLVADNRTRLGALIPRSAARQAQRRVAEREARDGRPSPAGAGRAPAR